MDAMKFLSEAKRMCNNAGPCNTCDASAFCGFTSVFPRDFGAVDQMQKMVKLVEKWAEEHPRKTRQSEFLERWPDVEKDGDGVPLLSPCFMDVAHYRTPEGICNRNGIDCDSCRKKYWLQEVE